MNIENMLNQLKDILPSENFKVQPDAAHQELLLLESEYNINTSEFLKNPVCVEQIPREIRDKWINTLETFLNFDGSMEDINHLPSPKNISKNKTFIKQNLGENSTKEYIKEKSKESGWLPCLFLF